METDELDAKLLAQLSSMGTSDRETKINDFRQVLGVDLTVDMCTFFLEMANWNLPDAIGAYYDHGERFSINDMSQIQHGYLNLQFVTDITIGEGESVSPSTNFIKTWRVKNNGSMHWPEGCKICFMEGSSLAAEPQHSIAAVPPGYDVDISVPMTSPSEPGIYQCRWQLNTAQQVPFGESIWCIIQVDNNGILDITQQLARAPLRDAPDINDDDKIPSAYAIGGNIPVSSSNNPFRQAAMLRSSPLNIRQREGTDGLPCTPCTPPDENMD